MSIDVKFANEMSVNEISINDMLLNEMFVYGVSKWNVNQIFILQQ
jgi:hypothetical protein